MIDITNWMPEFKVSAESDTELMNYFIKTPLIDKVISSGKWLIIGRKGTGKTAIYEYLRQSPAKSINNYFSVALGFRDYPWPVHKLYRESLESETSAYQRSWRYIIILKCVSNIIKIHEAEGKLPTELKEAKAYISKLFGSPNPTLLEIIKSKIFRLQSVNLPSIDLGAASAGLGGIELEDVAESDELQRKLRANAFNILDYVETLFEKYSSSHKQLVLIDQLDESWNPDQIAEYSKILVNLILCAQSINSRHSSKIKIVLFLRTDIYETLQFNDKNKIFQDGAVEIRWDYDSIDEMIFERITKHVPRTLKLENGYKTGAIFENKTVRHSATPLKHILRRSFYRPRDVLVYLNKIRDAHKLTRSGLYSSKDLYSADPLASQSLYNELIDEWSSQRPEFEKYLLAIQNIGYEIFEFKQFHEQYKRIDKSVSESQSRDILRFLYANSIVGQKISVNWEYVCTNPHLQIDYSKHFHVNNGLKYRLVLTENRAKREKKPTPKKPVGKKGKKTPNS